MKGQFTIIGVIIMLCITLSLATTAGLWLRNWLRSRVVLIQAEEPRCFYDDITKSFVGFFYLQNGGPGTINVTKENTRAYLMGNRIPNEMVVVHDARDPFNYIEPYEMFIVTISGLKKEKNVVKLLLGRGAYGAELTCTYAEKCYRIKGVWSQKLNNDPIINVNGPGSINIRIVGIAHEYCKK